jgi:hypothetical protein
MVTTSPFKSFFNRQVTERRNYSDLSGKCIEYSFDSWILFSNRAIFLNKRYPLFLSHAKRFVTGESREDGVSIGDKLIHKG